VNVATAASVCLDVLFTVKHNENIGFPNRPTSSYQSDRHLAYQSLLGAQGSRDGLQQAKCKLLSLDKGLSVVIKRSGSTEPEVARSLLSVAICKCKVVREGPWTMLLNMVQTVQKDPERQSGTRSR